jgi:hypothetical protein
MRLLRNDANEGVTLNVGMCKTDRDRAGDTLLPGGWGMNSEASSMRTDLMKQYGSKIFPADHPPDMLGSWLRGCDDHSGEVDHRVERHLPDFTDGFLPLERRVVGILTAYVQLRWPGETDHSAQH